MKSLLTEVELSMLLMDSKQQHKEIYNKRSQASLKQSNFSIRQPVTLDVINDSSKPLCDDFITCLDFANLKKDTLKPSLLKIS